MTPERTREDIFNDPALGRLARANRDYLNTHAEYIVPLAEMLLEAREALAVLGRQYDKLRHEADNQMRDLDDLERRLAEKDEALRVVHEYNCGCSRPGDINLCVAQPVVVFEALRAEPAKEEA